MRPPERVPHLCERHKWMVLSSMYRNHDVVYDHVEVGLLFEPNGRPITTTTNSCDCLRLHKTDSLMGRNAVSSWRCLIPAVLNLWSAAICLVVREQKVLFYFQGYKHTNRAILTIFHGSIFSGCPQPREKIGQDTANRLVVSKSI